MAGQPSDYGREVRDIVVKSGLTGVAASILAVTLFSPAGFGGMIGASLASGFGTEPTASAADNPYANLPAYPAPLSQSELSQIRGQLASTAASLELTRAATDEKIEHVRSLAVSGGMVTFSPAPRANSELRLSLSEPSSFTAAVVDEAPVEAYVVAAEPEAAATPVSYSGSSSFDTTVPYRDPHLELADLLLAHENF